jgi:hypothetical protein
MKNSGKNSKRRSKKIKKNAKRLAAYSAAAVATVMTTQNRTADAADLSFDILDISTSGANAVTVNFLNQSVGYAQYDSGWINSSEGSFVITRDYFYAPLLDAIGAFANPCTYDTEACGTGILPGRDANPYGTHPSSVFPLPHTSGPISANLSFAGRTYNAALSGFGNYANDSYFRYGSPSNAILGLQFTLTGSGTHYGWIALSPDGSDFIIHGFGYNDVAGAPSTPDLTTVDLPGDLDRNGILDTNDWEDLRDNLGADLSLETREDRYAMGDITNDGLNDIRDFDKFRDAYEAEHGGGSFAAMVAAAGVPEPSSILLLAAGAAGLGMWRNRKAK